MEEALAKIRPHTSSSLAHQKTPANILTVVESTFKEKGTDPTPTAYFATILTTLEGTIQKKDLSLEDGAILPAELYLLSLIAPFVSQPVLRLSLDNVLSLTAPLFPSLIQHAPALRSQLSLYQAIFKSLDRQQLDIPRVRQSFASVLQLCIDPRPKVRKKAADAIHDTLSHPTPPLLVHPYAERVAEWAKGVLVDASEMPFGKGKGGKSSTGAETAIHILAFLRPVITYLPPESLPSTTDVLLTLPRLGNTYLSQSCYSILAAIFSASLDDQSSNIDHQIPEVLKVILASPPSKSDAQLSSSWVTVLGGALVAYNATHPEEASSEVGRAWKAVWSFMDSADAGTRRLTASSLSQISTCFSPSLITSALADKNDSTTIRKIVNQVRKALDALPYARAIPELLDVISSLIKDLDYRESKSAPSAAEDLCTPVIARIAELRVEKSFEFKEAVDSTLSAAMRVLGPAVLLKILPLNLDPSSRSAGAEPRAFLLPLLAQPHPSPLSHFVSYFVPLSEQMFDLHQKADLEGRQSEAKVWNVLVGQVWAGLPGYCTGSPDLKQALNPAFSQLLSQLLYGQLELRPSILKALRTLVDSNVAVIEEPSAGEAVNTARLVSALSREETQANIDFLRTQVESWLAVLFNVYGSVGRESRGMVGDAITSWISIADEEEAHKAFTKVAQLFKTSLPQAQKTPNAGGDTGNMATTAQDILVLLLPCLSKTDARALHEISITPEVLSCKDNGVQKRGYKLLAKLYETDKVDEDAESVLKTLDELVDGLSAAAKKDRFALLAALIAKLSPTSLHVIPSLIPEAVLGTKEPSEKGRSAAFDLILAMGNKMNSGGIVKRSLIDGMDDDEGGKDDAMEDAQANIEEFLTMMAGGLAGASPHMISASVTAISRLIFEFKDSISSKMHDEILSTMLVFLSSANREIVKSVLGYVKLITHTLPAELIRPHLKELVPALLQRSHDHKNHFKVKVRHIFERLLRRFSWEEVYACAGEEEAAKVLVNIRKRKERAKRKKAARADDGEDDEETTKVAKGNTGAGDAFEDVLYGSESEIDDSDDEDLASAPGKKKDKTVEGARLKLDDDEPMDLLEGAASKITNTKRDRRKRPGQDASRFKVDSQSGKMVIDEESDEDQAGGGGVAEDVEGGAYKEALTSVDGFTRGPSGRVKFNKDTKKRRREEDAMDVDMADLDPDVSPGKAKKTKKKDQGSFGQEFKAKKAGGDVKKGGVDPYAYMSLSQAAKRGKGGRIGIAAKR